MTKSRPDEPVFTVQVIPTALGLRVVLQVQGGPVVVGLPMRAELAETVAVMLTEAAKQASTGLVVPKMNGGIVG